MPRIVPVVIALSGVLLAPAAAQAQNAADNRKWTIELYGGAAKGMGTANGSSDASFPAGAPFTLVSGQPSRAVSSWFFGDGAVLMNQVLTQFSAASGITFPRIESLNDAFASSGGKLGAGALFGLRVGRALSSKLGVEFNVEVSKAKLELSDELEAGLQAASDSFTDVFETLLANAPVTNPVVSSSVTIRPFAGSQTRLSGAAKWTVFDGKRIDAYLTGGGGLIRNGGEPPQAVLNGRYTFRYFGTFQMEELDRVVVTLNQQKTSAMGVLGGGFTYDFSSKAGVRFDLRLLLNSSKGRTTMTAVPGSVAQNPTQVLTTAATISPGLQFSTQAGVRTTLSGPNVSQTIFTGSGLSKQMAFSVGVFKRF
jgi:hypothetical protein